MSLARDEYDWEYEEMLIIEHEITRYESQTNFDRAESFNLYSIGQSHQIMNSARNSAEIAVWMAGLSAIMTVVGITITIALGI